MKFWVLERPMMVGAWAFAEPTGAEYGEAPRCRSCGTFIASRPWLVPYRVRLVKGTKTSAPGDVISGPGIETFIASSHFIVEFERANLTGIERWEPVEIEGYNDYEGAPVAQEVVERTYKVAILPVPETRVKLDQMHAVFKEPPDCLVCGRIESLDSYKGVVVDEASWNGDDIVRVTNLNLLIVTDHFAEFFRSGEFTGTHVVPAATFAPSYAKRSY